MNSQQALTIIRRWYRMVDQQITAEDYIRRNTEIEVADRILTSKDWDRLSQDQKRFVNDLLCGLRHT